MGTKKVLVFVPRLLETGGIESHLKEFFNQLKDQNIELYLLVLDSKTSEITKKQYRQYANKTWLIQSNNSIIRLLLFLRFLPSILAIKFDSFYSNGQGNSIHFIRKIVGKKSNWIHHHHTSGEANDQRTWTKNYIKTLTQCDTLIACSNYSANLISKNTKRAVSSIPCFSREINAIKKKKKDQAPIKLAFFGRLIQEKGIELLCKLSNERKADFEIHIWGRGDNYPPSFFSQFTNLKYHGSFSSKQELEGILSEIDAFLLISTHPEGLPISLLEVMSAGLPWMASGSNGMEEIKTNDSFNVILPHEISYTHLMNRIELFVYQIANTDLSSFSEKQKNVYRNTYSCKIVKAKWLEILS